MITSPKAENPTIIKINQKKRKATIKDLCWVVSIDGIKPVDISVDQVQQFASQIGIKGLCCAPKKEIFDGIANEKDNPSPKNKKKCAGYSFKESHQLEEVLQCSVQ